MLKKIFLFSTFLLINNSWSYFKEPNISQGIIGTAISGISFCSFINSTSNELKAAYGIFGAVGICILLNYLKKRYNVISRTNEQIIANAEEDYEECLDDYSSLIDKVTSYNLKQDNNQQIEKEILEVIYSINQDLSYKFMDFVRQTEIIINILMKHLEWLAPINNAVDISNKIRELKDNLITINYLVFSSKNYKIELLRRQVSELARIQSKSPSVYYYNRRYL